MDYTIASDYEEMCKRAAHKIADTINREVKAKGRAVIGLATGSTPEGVYKELVEMYRNGEVSFANVTSFNLDEYVVDAKAHPDFYKTPESYHGFMQKHLFDHVDIKPENIHVPDGMAHDLQEECRQYELKIREAGGIDLQLVGIGQNGHIGFCEPGSPMDGKTSVVNLAQETIDVNIEKFGFAAPQAISMGLGTVMEAKEVLLIANGVKKAPIIAHSARNLTQRVEENPAKVLDYHRHAHAIIDEQAADALLIKPQDIKMMAR